MVCAEQVGLALEDFRVEYFICNSAAYNLLMLWKIIIFFFSPSLSYGIYCLSLPSVATFS